MTNERFGIVAVLIALSVVAGPASGDDTILFDFEAAGAAADWASAKLPEVKADQPASRIEVVEGKNAGAGGKCLKLTFEGGEWPVVATTRIPVEGNWRQFRTIKADLTVDAPLVAYFRILQGQPDDKGKQPYWEKTMILQPGPNPMTIVIHGGIGAMDANKGNITGFIIGAFRPDKGQVMLVDDVRLGTDWPWTRVVSWYSPYNHDGYSSAVQREYRRTGTMTKFKVLGTDLEVADVAGLTNMLKSKWVKPEPKTIDQVEAEFKAEFDKLKAAHPKAVPAIFRDGEKGWDVSNPDKVYSGWKMVYVSCHGPDGPNGGRENTPVLYDTVEAFMRHRSPLMQADLSSIPKGSAILAAKLVVTRTDAASPTGERTPFKPNTWVAEPCNREWDPKSANCYFYASGKHWKAVSGLYYGEDPDYWPVFIAYGPAGVGVISDWDFTEALKFWTDGTHENHGFFLYGDSVDYMRIFTPKAKDVRQRPTLMVIYEPK